MAWDFETDPEFQKKLDWIEEFMEEKVEPLSNLGMAVRGTLGRDIRDFEWFSLLAKFKSGCLLEYKVAQAEAGILPKETGRFFARIVENVFKETKAQIARMS